MNQHAVVSTFSHVKPGDTEFTGGGLRDFFLYRDLGIAAADALILQRIASEQLGFAPPVPEPASALLLAGGLAAIGWRRRAGARA